MPKYKAHTPVDPRIHTFDEVFGGGNLRVTVSERIALVWHLAALRARKTVEALLPKTDPKLTLGFDPNDILRGED